MASAMSTSSKDCKSWSTPRRCFGEYCCALESLRAKPWVACAAWGCWSSSLRGELWLIAGECMPAATARQGCRDGLAQSSGEECVRPPAEIALLLAMEWNASRGTWEYSAAGFVTCESMGQPSGPLITADKQAVCTGQRSNQSEMLCDELLQGAVELSVEYVMHEQESKGFDVLVNNQVSNRVVGRVAGPATSFERLGVASSYAHRNNSPVRRRTLNRSRRVS
jgi:hypothetical protein